MISKPILFGSPPYVIRVSLDKEVLREDIRHVRSAMYHWYNGQKHIRKAYILTL
jgi:hypothetical protein